MEYEHIRVNREDAFVVVTMARPERRNALTPAMLFGLHDVLEGWADDLEAAMEIAARGDIDFQPNHHFDAVGPMTGLTTRSMPVMVVENRRYGNRAYCTLNEGLGKVMRFGGNSAEVLDRLRWMSATFGPILSKALAESDGIALKSIVARGLTMGDEMHQRNVACTSLLLRELAPVLVRTSSDTGSLESAIAFIAGNDQFFLNVAMVMGKAIMDPVRGIEASSIVTAMARNGTDFGVRISATDERWFTAPVDGRLLVPLRPPPTQVRPACASSVQWVGFGAAGFSGGGATWADAERETSRTAARPRHETMREVLTGGPSRMVDRDGERGRREEVARVRDHDAVGAGLLRGRHQRRQPAATGHLHRGGAARARRASRRADAEVHDVAASDFPQRAAADVAHEREADDRAKQIARERELIQTYRSHRKHAKMHEHERRLAAIEPAEAPKRAVNLALSSVGAGRAPVESIRIREEIGRAHV